MVFLKPHNLAPADYVFVDFQEPHGLKKDEFIQTVLSLKAQVAAGERKIIHDRYDILILSPETVGGSSAHDVQDVRLHTIGHITSSAVDAIRP